MNNNKAIASAVLICICGLIAYGGTRSSQVGSQTSANVLVTNPSTQPVPVNFPHTPTVAALQSGTWRIAGIANVHVMNASSSPVLVKDIDRGASNLFQHYWSIGVAQTIVYPQPAGHRLIVTNVAASGAAATSTLNVWVPNGDMSIAAHISVPLVYQDAKALTSGNEQVLFYVDPGQSIVLTGNAVGGEDCTLSGYTVPSPS